MKRSAFLLCALVAGAAVNAQVYQYKDASGRTVYSDQPPPAPVAPKRAGKVVDSSINPASGPEAEKDKAPAIAPAAGSTAPKSLADREMDFNKRQKERQEREAKEQKEAANRQAMKDECERAQRQLQIFDSGQRISTQDANGERVYLDDTKRAEEAARIRKFIADNCKQ